MRKIKFTDGCPNGCEYCYEPKRDIKYYDPIFSNLENIQILDMNFLSNPHALKILKSLNKGNYEFVCGVDFRRLTQEICNLMKEKGFIKIRWAWDYGFEQQKIHNKVWKMFKKVGYKNEDLSVFVLCDWKIPYEENLRKLDLLKVWNVKINDCWYDGVVSPNFQLKYWNLEQCKDFRHKCRKHNQMVLFKIDPELSPSKPRKEEE